MSVASQQQDDIASELSTAFENHPVISVEAIGSTPSEEYRVTFTSCGLITDENEEIKESRHHIIQITIPFGFPLFPPSCKPLTPIFHPDFDPGAICLGDFWDQDRTCTELIEFLGKMITGELYSKENAFNEKAAIWYIAHADQFPLTDSKAPFAHGGASEEMLDFDLDTVKEEDFSTDFDYLSLESDDLATEKPAQPFNKSKDYDLDLLQERLSQKRFQQLDRELTAIPISVDFEERDFLRRETDKALTASKNLQKQAQQSEAAGDLKKALATYKEAHATVADLYGVENTIQRIQQAIELGSLKPLQNQPQEELVESEEELAPPTKWQLPKININISAKYLLIIPAVAVLVLGFQFLTSSKHAKNARSFYSQCTKALGQKNFRQAQTSCEQAYQESLTVGFIYTAKMNQLAAQAKKILDSEELTQGLVGKILVDGVWVYQDETIRISPFGTLISKAEETVKKKKWVEAIKTLRQASPLAKTDLEKKTVQELMVTVDFYKAEEDALAAHDKEGCTGGVDFLLAAQNKAALLPVEIRNQHLPEISYKLTECTFFNLIGEGNKLYEAADWNDALPLYRDALQKIENSPFPERVAIADIKNKINKAELYAAIDLGNRSFAGGDWNKAIAQYQQAILLINHDPSLSSNANSELNSAKLARIILQAKIIRGEQLAKKARNQNQFTDAIAQYQKVEQIIKTTDFAKEKDFVRALESIGAEILSLKKQAVIEKQRQYLLTNFMNLFLQNYPAATEETLISPVVFFVAEDTENFTYKLQATEIGRGRPLSLVMFYKYNIKTKQWKFTSAPE